MTGWTNSLGQIDENRAAFWDGVVDYDPLTGKMTWAFSRYKAIKGHEVGYTDPLGYRAFQYKGKMRRVHRVAWVILNDEKPEVIDHINRDRSDNRSANLGNGDSLSNSRNRGSCKANSSGATGVFFNKDAKKWQAQISVENKTRYLGVYGDWHEAAYVAYYTRQDFGFAKNHGCVG